MLALSSVQIVRDQLSCRFVVSELEAVAKGVPISNDGLHVHRSKGKIDVQVHGFADPQFNWQRGRHSGFAYLYRETRGRTQSFGLDRDIDLQLEPGVPACISHGLFDLSCSSELVPLFSSKTTVTLLPHYFVCPRSDVPIS
jgi:hypothetical protein